MYGDLNTPMKPLHEASMFSLLVCTQVFEHVRNPHNAADVLYNLLLPGGLLIWTAPFMERFHGFDLISPQDHLRYTAPGGLRLLLDHGFELVDAYVGGDLSLTILYFLGYGERDLSPSTQFLIPYNQWQKSKTGQHGLNKYDFSLITCLLLRKQ